MVDEPISTVTPAFQNLPSWDMLCTFPKHPQLSGGVRAASVPGLSGPAAALGADHCVPPPFFGTSQMGRRAWRFVRCPSPVVTRP